MAKRLQILARLGFRVHPKGIQIINEESFKLLRKNMRKFFSKKIPIYSVECPYLLSKRDAEDAKIGYVEDIFLIKDFIIALCNYPSLEEPLRLPKARFAPNWQVQWKYANGVMPVKLNEINYVDYPILEESGMLWEPSSVNINSAVLICVDIKYLLRHDYPKNYTVFIESMLHPRGIELLKNLSKISRVCLIDPMFASGLNCVRLVKAFDDQGIQTSNICFEKFFNEPSSYELKRIYNSGYIKVYSSLDDGAKKLKKIKSMLEEYDQFYSIQVPNHI